MTDIDDEALAKAGWDAYYERSLAQGWMTEAAHESWGHAARAVVAAYQEQMRARGVVEVPLSHLRVALNLIDAAYDGAPDQVTDLMVTVTRITEEENA